MKLFSLVLAVTASFAMAVCPNKCSGHGSCNSADKCSCQPRWTGQDCSLRECPFGLSWTAEGSGVVPAGGGLGGLHPYTECSSKGSCDRSTGECECFAGYEGRGCRRQRCPNDCSGNGRCIYNSASDSEYTATAGAKFGSQFWDAGMTRVCACDRGWQGYDCSVRICPKGDDPVTDCKTGGATAANSAAHNMVQRLYVQTYEETPGVGRGFPTAAYCVDSNCTTQAKCIGTNGGDECNSTWVVPTCVSATDAQPGIMAGKFRTDQNEGWCSIALTSESACETSALGNFKWTGAACITQAYKAAQCTRTDAPAETWVKNACNPNSAQGTGGPNLDTAAAGFELYGYISLKYTDMFGGEYFTRPILIDTSRAATQSSKLLMPTQQWATTKNAMYQTSASAPGTGALRVEGTCSTNTIFHEKDCEEAGAVWTASTTGFMLGGAATSTHTTILQDRMKSGHLKRYTADRIRDALQDLPNFAIPSVNVTNFDSGNSIWGNVFDITFTDEATSGKQNLLECVYDSARACDGAQPKMATSTSVTNTPGTNGGLSETVAYGNNAGDTAIVNCEVFEVPLSGTDTYEEHAECSNRGLCDGSTGICDCFEGHTGESCSTQTIFF